MGGSGKKEAAPGKGNTKHQGKEVEYSSGRKGLSAGVEGLGTDLSPPLTSCKYSLHHS